MKTLKNKLYAVVLLICGYLLVLIDKDATALVFFCIYRNTIVLCKRKLDLLRIEPPTTALFFFASFRQNYNPYCGKRCYSKGVKGAWTK